MSAQRTPEERAEMAQRRFAMLVALIVGAAWASLAARIGYRAVALAPVFAVALILAERER